jgi:hypothetical protein
MKRLTIIIITTIILLFPIVSIAQQKSPGNPGGEPTGSDPPLGGGAPLGGGLFILLVMGGAYGGVKLYQKKKKIILD